MFQNRWTQLRTWLATWSISSIEKNPFMGVFPSPHTAENPKNCLSRPLIHTTVLNNKSLFKDKSALWLTIRLKIARPLCVCGIAHREFMSIFHTLQFDEIFLQIFFCFTCWFQSSSNHMDLLCNFIYGPKDYIILIQCSFYQFYHLKEQNIKDIDK